MSKIPNDPGYRAGWCIHYRYNRGAKTPEENTCEAGVRYDTIDRIMAKSPCFIKPGETAADRSPCAKLRPPTTEEIAAHEEWSAKRRADLTTVMVAIAPWRMEQKKKRVGASQVIDCPACHGKHSLSLSISGYNGHVHGRCSTEGCVSWME